MNTHDRYERAFGTLYAATKDMSTKDVAAHLRRCVKQAAKDGLISSAYRYSVRHRWATHSPCIDLDIIVPDALVDMLHEFETAHGRWTSEWCAEQMRDNPKWAPLAELRATYLLLTDMHNAYNYDGSDTMTDYFDVRFYGRADIMGERRWDLLHPKRGSK